MKRRAIMAVLFFLIVSGCVETTRPETIEKIDIAEIEFDSSEKDASYALIKSKQDYDRHGDMVYLHPDLSIWLYYWDLESGEVGKLCGKPECDHTRETCNAIAEGNGGVQYYDGYIYFAAGGGVLFRVREDGTNREIVRTFKSLMGTNGYWIIHRDKLYTQVTRDEVKDGEPRSMLYVYQYDLEGMEEGKLLIQEEFDERILPIVEWRFRGDYAYFMVESGEVGNRQRTIYITEAESGDTEKVMDETGRNRSTQDYHIHEQELLMLEKNVTDMWLVRYNLLDGTAEEVFHYPHANRYMGFISEDEEKVLVYDFLYDEEARWVYLLNMEGEVEREWVLPPGMTLRICDSTEEGFIMRDDDTYGEPDRFKYWLFPYDGGEAEILLELVDYIRQ